MQENVLNESAMMIPETKKRLEAVYNDLRSYVVSDRLRVGMCVHLW